MIPNIVRNPELLATLLVSRLLVLRLTSLTAIRSRATRALGELLRIGSIRDTAVRADSAYHADLVGFLLGGANSGELGSAVRQFGRFSFDDEAVSEVEHDGSVLNHDGFQAQSEDLIEMFY